MPEDAPPDPFAAGHAGYVSVLENFRGLRAAGGGMLESAFLTVAWVLATGAVHGEASE